MFSIHSVLLHTQLYIISGEENPGVGTEILFLQERAEITDGLWNAATGGERGQIAPAKRPVERRELSGRVVFRGGVDLLLGGIHGCAELKLLGGF